MRILVLTPSPLPITDGHTLRIRHILRSFPRDYELDLICVGSPTDALQPNDLAAAIGATCRSVSFFPAGKPAELRRNKPLWEKVYRVLFPDALSPGYVISAAIRDELQTRLASGQYDLLLYSGVSMFLHQKDLNVTIPTVVDLIDSYSLYFRNEFNSQVRFSRRLSALINLIWANRYEHLHCGEARNIVVITPLDQASLQKNCPNSRTWAIPNGVDTDYFVSNSQPRPGNHLLFTGVMDYEPNVTSIIFFIEKILPRIRSEVPDVTLTVAGKSPTPKLLAVASAVPGIVVTGEVADIRPYFEQAGVYVAPMISGAGLKNKILEAWAMAKPVVATSMACSGIEPVEGENVLIADSPAEFARMVITVLQDPVRRARMGAISRRTVEEAFSWKLQAQRFARIFDELVHPVH